VAPLCGDLKEEVADSRGLASLMVNDMPIWIDRREADGGSKNAIIKHPDNVCPVDGFLPNQICFAVAIKVRYSRNVPYGGNGA
jgi:hypothetical protein